MAITSLLIRSADARYNTQAFCTIIETMLPTLRNAADTRLLDIEPAVAQRFRGNFYGLLQSLRVDQSLFFTTLRMNYYTSPHDYDAEKLTIMVPSQASVKQISTTRKEALGKVVSL